MKRFISICLVMAALLLFVLVSCEAEAVQVTRVVTEEKVVVQTEIVEVAGEEMIVEKEVVVTAVVEVASGSPAISPAGAADLSIAASNQLQQQRMIIKDGEIAIGMANSEATVNNVVQVAVDYGGYVVSQRVWQRDGFTYATITMGVPVNEFENAMRRLRTMADEVRDESASGTDVSDEYVDLNSKLTNLKATRDRIRTFLDQADTVEESLDVNEQLSEIEGQIAEIQGRINYLAGRAAYSTITVHVEPIIPTPTPSPTPTSTPTPTPTPTAEPWRASKTIDRAAEKLSGNMISLTDSLIYNGIVCGPYLVVLVIGAWLVSRVWRRFSN